MPRNRKDACMYVQPLSIHACTSILLAVRVDSLHPVSQHHAAVMMRLKEDAVYNTTVTPYSKYTYYYCCTCI